MTVTSNNSFINKNEYITRCWGKQDMTRLKAHFIQAVKMAVYKSDVCAKTRKFFSV